MTLAAVTLCLARYNSIYKRINFLYIIIIIYFIIFGTFLLFTFILLLLFIIYLLLVLEHFYYFIKI